MTKPKHLIRSLRRQQRGYVLLTLLLFMAVLVIAAAAVAPTIAMQIRRDQEEELIHRGMQYRRAIRRFIKQTGRYPTKLEDLDTGSVRYLRKRYKDPITGREFRPLHMLDVPQVGGPIPNPSSSQSSGSENGSPGDSAAAPAVATGQDQTEMTTEQTPQASGSGGSPIRAAAPPATATVPKNLGGGVIIGVASTSSRKTIREFNHVNRYDKWLFFYDPALDRTKETYGPTPIGRVPTALQSPPSSVNSQEQSAPHQ
jgi:type II secretory pathway pseudopilin PulG